jgi:microcystin degradation protein MlrC
MARVGLLGFLHESNTFLATETTYDNFATTSLTQGAALLSRWRGAHHELGGLIAGCDEAGLTIVPGMATFAVPSGTITAAAYERLAVELVSSIEPGLDGLLVALHGATASADFPDADGELLRRIRQVTGPELPIIVTLDLHANISEDMARFSTAMVVYRTNPHLDQFERGREAALLMARLLTGDVRPVQALETPPMLIRISKQHTAVEPARGLYADLETVLTWPGILSASVAMGFYYADVPEMGMSFLAVADGDEALARRAAQWMSQRAWLRRREFVGRLPSPAEAVQHTGKRPLVLMDVGDNVGAGSPGDSTILFAEVMRQGLKNAMVILYDPAAVERCLAAGIRNTVKLSVGARTDTLHGAPVTIEGKVRTLSDGIFVETQIRHGGWGGGDQGITAVVETADGHTIVLTSRRMAPMSLEQVISLGIHPERKDILIVKGVVAPRAAYEPVAGEILLVDTAGVTSDNPSVFDYRRRRRPLYPLEES